MARGKFVRAYNCQETEEGRFILSAKEQINKMFKGPLEVYMRFFMPRPKNHYGTGKNSGKLKASAPEYHISTPDCDNMEKFVSDCLNGLAWEDDKQIVKSISEKIYSENPRTEIVIKEKGDL